MALVLLITSSLVAGCASARERLPVVDQLRDAGSPAVDEPRQDVRVRRADVRPPSSLYGAAADEDARAGAALPENTPSRDIGPDGEMSVFGSGGAMSDDTELVARLETLLSAVLAAADANVSVIIIDDAGELVFAHRPDELMLPASTLKVLTVAAAWHTFGVDGRIPTHAEATAQVAADGTLQGDLVIVGRGDPTVSTDEYIRWVYPARPATRLALLADTIVASGVRYITGNVVGTAPGFTGPASAEGWLPRYFSDFDARLASGLTVDAGLQTLVTFDNSTAADETGGMPAGDVIAGDHDAEAALPPLDLDGITPEQVRVEHAVDPAHQTVVELTRMLRQRGVHIDGVSVTASEPPPTVRRLASINSVDVQAMGRFALEHSDNHMADGLLRLVGHARDGSGSFAGGQAGIASTLRELGVDLGGAVLADGSGLSRDNAISTRMLVETDRVMAAGVYADEWASSMAIMGKTGTLRRRLVGTVADGRFVGKTGSLRDVMSINGTVHGDQRSFHLAVIANDTQGEHRWLMRTLMDEIILLVSAEAADCDAEFAAVESSPADRTVRLGPLTISCAA